MEEQIKLIKEKLAELELENTTLQIRVKVLEEETKELANKLKEAQLGNKPLKKYVKNSNGVIVVEEEVDNE